jgi:hypothetical protein
MCTLTVITREQGYLLGMNRDERITRGAGLPPQAYERRGMRFVHPGDGTGGTWIGVNELGIAFALLNWNDIAAPPVPQPRSRGQVIPELLVSRSPVEAEQFLRDSDLNRISPFRLTGVFPAERRISEWRWDGARLCSATTAWRLHYGFSSGLGDQRVAVERRQACAEAQKEQDAGSVLWLRRLHAGHRNGPGAFSLCVHRPEVETLSYSEIEHGPGLVRMAYFLGSPCSPVCCHQIQLRKESALPHLLSSKPSQSVAWSA